MRSQADFFLLRSFFILKHHHHHYYHCAMVEMCVGGGEYAFSQFRLHETLPEARNFCSSPGDNLEMIRNEKKSSRLPSSWTFVIIEEAKQSKSRKKTFPFMRRAKNFTPELSEAACTTFSSRFNVTTDSEWKFEENLKIFWVRRQVSAANNKIASSSGYASSSEVELAPIWTVTRRNLSADLSRSRWEVFPQFFLF